jgi:hypothetical protein
MEQEGFVNGRRTVWMPKGHKLWSSADTEVASGLLRGKLILLSDFWSHKSAAKDCQHGSKFKLLVRVCKNSPKLHFCKNSKKSKCAKSAKFASENLQQTAAEKSGGFDRMCSS